MDHHLPHNHKARRKPPYAAAPPAIIPGAGAVMGVTTKLAGSVDLTLPAGMDIPEGSIDLNLTEAGAVKSTLIGAGAPLVSSADAGGASRAAGRVKPGGLRVNTTRAGSVQAHGAIEGVDTSYAGSVKISFTGPVRDWEERRY